MTELVARALAWVDEVHPHARHLARTREWVIVLDPEADEALQIAAVIHDIERAFPAGDDPFDPAAPPGGDGYDEWHQRRSADIGERWLRKQGAPDALTADVAALIRVHESGGSPRADVLQAADSLSFLETQTDLFIGMVRDGRLTRERAEQKLQLMQDRIRIPSAGELGVPRLAAALARLDAAIPPAKESSMRAYILEDLDRPPALADVPVPPVADHEVLVRVHAASVNPIDRAIVAGEVSGWMDYEFPVTLGRDLAGSVERIGAAVTRFAVGDEVFGYIAKPVAHDGSFADYVVVPEDEFIVARPAGLDAVHAGALGLAAVTAMMCVDATGVAAGDRLLINGATGGVGNYAIQIAKALGVDVIASARPGAEEDHVRALGADEVIDWSDGDLAALVRAAHPDGVQGLVDVVTDTPERFAALAREVLAPGGRAATTRGVGDPELLGAIEAANVFSAPDIALLVRIADLVREGRLRAPVAEVHAFDRIEDAFAALSRGALGKIAITLVEGELKLMGMLDGKIAIVTGAGAGLGRSHCHALAAEGATVVVSNRVRADGARPSAEVVAQEIADAGGTAIADTCDVEDWDALGALVQRTVSDLGRLDIVVNNAGILVWDAICDIDEATYDELMTINVKGTFALTRHACAYWRDAAGRGERVTGRIINTTSGIGLFGFPRGGLYGTSKGAVVSLAKVTAMEMRPYGVTANVIWPEARTRMGKGIFPDAPDEPGAFDPYHPENISPLVVYLASDAAGWVSGQVFYVQGDRVQRIAGWSVDGEYRSESGRSLEPAELANAIPLLHNALPPLQPGTSLQDAMQGIDPEREG